MKVILKNKKKYANSFISYSGIEWRDWEKYMPMRKELLQLWAHPDSIVRTLFWCFSKEAIELRKEILTYNGHSGNEIFILDISTLLYSYTWLDTPELMQYRREMFDKTIDIDYIPYRDGLPEKVISSLLWIRSPEAQKLREEFYKKRPYYVDMDKKYKRSIEEDMNYLSSEEWNKLIEKLFERFKKNPNRNNLRSFVFKLRWINTIRAQEIRNDFFEILNTMEFSKSDSDERMWLYRVLSENISNKVVAKPMVFEKVKNELFLPKISGLN